MLFTLMRHPVLLETVKREKRGGAVQFVRLYPARAAAVSQVSGRGRQQTGTFRATTTPLLRRWKRRLGQGKICNILHGHICLGKTRE